ncbi:hypothetical protein DMP17_12725 [Pseudonocardia sp. TMWB2A]
MIAKEPDKERADDDEKQRNRCRLERAIDIIALGPGRHFLERIIAQRFFLPFDQSAIFRIITVHRICGGLARAIKRTVRRDKNGDIALGPVHHRFLFAHDRRLALYFGGLQKVGHIIARQRIQPCSRLCELVRRGIKLCGMAGERIGDRLTRAARIKAIVQRG